MGFHFLAPYTVESHAKVRKSFPRPLFTRTGTSTSDASPVAKEVKAVLPLAADYTVPWVHPML